MAMMRIHAASSSYNNKLTFVSSIYNINNMVLYTFPRRNVCGIFTIENRKWHYNN